MLPLANRDSLRSSSLPIPQPIPRSFSDLISDMTKFFNGVAGFLGSIIESVNSAKEICQLLRPDEGLKQMELRSGNNFQFP